MFPMAATIAMASDLELDESVIRYVVVERIYDPVAVAPRLGVGPNAEGVRLVLGVTGHVEPVTCPALAMRWRRKGGETWSKPG